MNVETFTALVVIAHESRVAFRNYGRRRKIERACRACGSENVHRVHEMKQLMGNTYSKGTRSKCMDCGTGRVDKPAEPKDFKWPDILWRRIFHQEVFVEHLDGSLQRRFQYWEGGSHRLHDYFDPPPDPVKPAALVKPHFQIPSVKIEFNGK